MSGDGNAQRWEYKVVQWVGNMWHTSGDWELEELKGLSSEQVLNHFGAQGWEFVAIGPVQAEMSKPAAAYIFKRLAPTD